MKIFSSNFSRNQKVYTLRLCSVGKVTCIFLVGYEGTLLPIDSFKAHINRSFCGNAVLMSWNSLANNRSADGDKIYPKFLEISPAIYIRSYN